MTTYSTTSDDIVVKLMIFYFQWCVVFSYVIQGHTMTQHINLDCYIYFVNWIMGRADVSIPLGLAWWDPTWYLLSLARMGDKNICEGLGPYWLLCQKLGKMLTGPMYKLLLSFTVISDVYWTFILNKTKLDLLSNVLLSGFQSFLGAVGAALTTSSSLT